MAWAKVTNRETGESHWDTSPEAWDEELYDVLLIVDDRCPDGLEDVDETGAIVVPLARLQAATWAQVKVIRETLEEGTAPTPWGPVQVDERSKAKIQGVLQMAKLAEEVGAPFTEHFTLADNSVIELDGTSARQLALAAATFVSQVYARGRELRAAIFAEEATAESIAALDIEGGWPDAG